MRKFLLLAAAVAATGLIVVAAASAATVRNINPVLVDGNPDCKDPVLKELGVTSAIQAKFAEPVNGSTDGRVTLLLSSNGVPFEWFVLNHEDVDAVIVKGGSGANVYRYPDSNDPASQHFSDGGLTTPLNKSGKPAALGSVTVCYTP
jgi:hypothetical protein